MAETNFEHLRSRTQDGVLVLTVTTAHVQGDTIADALRGELFAAVDQAGAARVVLDFGPVTYISSAAFRPLLSLRRKLQEAGGHFVLCNLSPAVADVFQVTRLVSTSPSASAPFETAPDVAAAVAQLNGP